MRQNRPAQSGFFAPRFLLGVTLFLAGTFLAFLSFAAAPSRLPDQAVAVQKIAPWVIEHTANGNEAEFLVVLADQADLQGAKAVTTKEEKGRYVRNALWEKAQATQSPLLKWLEERKIEHRSYYIVNLVWVKAGIDVATALAARPDVLRVEGNPQISNDLEPVSEGKAASQPDSTDSIEQGITLSLIHI